MKKLFFLFFLTGLLACNTGSDKSKDNDNQDLLEEVDEKSDQNMDEINEESEDSNLKEEVKQIKEKADEVLDDAIEELEEIN